MATQCATCERMRLVVSVGLVVAFASLGIVSMANGVLPPVWLLVALCVSVCGAAWVVTDQTRRRKERQNDGVR
jgi:protein-S-isoprenylcysteine O-methyltransferase Ste14